MKEPWRLPYLPGSQLLQITSGCTWHKCKFCSLFPESQLYQEVLDGTYTEEPEIERLMEMRTLIDRLNIRVNLLGHHISNTVPITGALPDDKAAILREFDKAIAEFPEEELKSYRSRIWHLWRFLIHFRSVPTRTGFFHAIMSLKICNFPLNLICRIWGNMLPNIA